MAANAAEHAIYEITPEDRARADLYALVGGLLLSAPSKEVLQSLAGLVAVK
jgi:hypothetical protein